MKEMNKRFARALGRGIIRIMIFVIRFTPFEASLRIGSFLGNTMRKFSKKRYQVALKNLDIAYGDSLSASEKEHIAKESFRQFGMFSIEMIKFPFVSDSEVLKRVDNQAYEDILEALKQQRGCIMISGHLGNFEVGARWLSIHGHRSTALAREARDRGTTEIMNDLRRRNGFDVISIRHSVKAIMLALRNNKIVGIICDQNATDVFAPFFGRPTGTVDGPARISMKMNAPLVFYSCSRHENGKYSIKSYGAYWPEPSDNPQDDILRITTEINRRLEIMIRDNPEQWLWFHDRWKSSPSVTQNHSETSAAKKAQL
jgi:KDO2-lipid IV(A) lauroyltransferase